MVTDKGKSMAIEEDPNVVLEERPTYQPPKKVRIYSRKKETIKKQQTLPTLTTSEGSTVSSLARSVPSPPRGTPPNVIDIDSPPRGPPPSDHPPMKMQKDEVEKVVDYLNTKEDDILITPKEIQQGMPSPIRDIVSSSGGDVLRLGKVDLRGLNSVDDLRQESCKEFMEDDSFIETKEFRDSLWREKASEYTENVARERTLHLKIPRSVIQVDVRKAMKKEFQNMIAKEGRTLVHKSGVLLFPE